MRSNSVWSRTRVAQSRGMLACLAVAALLVRATSGSAQTASTGPATGTLVVRVLRADSTPMPIPGAFVRSERIAGVTDAAGVVRIELPATLRAIVVSGPGFETRTFEMTIVGGVSQRVDIHLALARADLSSSVTTVTRAERRHRDQPAIVDVLGSERLLDATLDRPTDLTRLLARADGAFPQATTGPLAGHRLRLNGQSGDLTAVLIDGIPLVGGYPGSFALVQLTPFEFSRVEIVKGAASGWYGPLAAGGVVNLVSRRPDRGSARLQVHQSSEKGGDLAFWGATRPSPTVGFTVLADVHQQRLVDADDDNWGEFPRAIRANLRPRLFVDLPNGDGLTVTAGGTTEDRTGGFLFNPSGQDVYREERRTRRGDFAVTGWRGQPGAGRLEFKFAGVFQAVSYNYDALRERDHRTTWFGEASYLRAVGPFTGGVGVAYQRDALFDRDLVGFDYLHQGPATFAHATVSTEGWAATAAGRCDDNNVYGALCGGNIALLFRPAPALTARVMVGRGVYPPTAFTEETETVSLRGLKPSVLSVERTTTANLDVGWISGPLELGGAVAFNRIAGAVRAVPAFGDPAGRLTLANIEAPTRVVTATARVGYRRDPFAVRASYSLQRGSEGVTPTGSGQRDLDHVPRHLGLIELTWRPPWISDGRVHAFTRIVGPQSVWDNPYRTRTPTYVMSDLVLSQRTGRARIYLSGENLFNVRLRDSEPIFLDVPTAGLRRTAAPWAPIRGRVLSLGALVDW